MKKRLFLFGALSLGIAIAVLGFIGGWDIDLFHPGRLIHALKSKKPWRNDEISLEAKVAESLGFDPLKLAKLSDGLAARNTKAFLIVRRDTIVHEYYGLDFGPDHRHYTASMAKALVGSVALSIALDEKALTLDQPVSTYLPSWKADPERSKITIRHLATHTSGLEDSLPKDGKKPADENDWKSIYWRDRPARFRLAMTKASVIRPPGSEILYSNPGFAILSYIVTASLSGSEHTDIYNLLLHRIMRPLSIPDAAWSISYGESFDVNGLKVNATGGGAMFSIRAAARVGQLMLKRGSWGDRQLLSHETVTTVTSSAAPKETVCPADHPMPGLGWWTNANKAWPSLPRDAFAGAGHGHEIILIIPSMDLVVVRFGLALDSNQPYDVSGPFWKPVKKYLFEPLAEAVG